MLVVDDDDVILVALGKLLERQGFEVVTAARPGVAFDLLVAAEREHKPFDVVLSDYRMPEMVGSELLAKVAVAAPDAARLLITANTDFDTVSDAVNRGGVQRVVAKPWKPTELFSAVSEGARLARLQRENRSLQLAVQQQNELLRTTNERLDRLVHERTVNLLDGLISALDFRDTDTQWHSRRVALYARRLAQQLGITEPQLTVVEQGALLHDIGKIGVRDSVLLKPGPLDDAEWVEMKRHAQIGYDLIQPIDFLHGAAMVVLHHHERFDGAGYPQGLRGDQLVIGARIFAVVDTYDAITSDRPYRAGREPAVAIAEVTRCSGSQFDPAVASAFTAVPIVEWVALRTQLDEMAVAHRNELPTLRAIPVIPKLKPDAGAH